MPSPRYKPRSYVVGNARYGAHHSHLLGGWLITAPADRLIGLVCRRGPHNWRAFTPHGKPTGPAWRSLKQGVTYLAHQEAA